MFLGNSFANGKGSSTPTLTLASKIDYLSIKNAIFKELMVTNTYLREYNGNIPQEWDFDTNIHAHFNGNLHAGNVQFTESIVEKIRLKKRTPHDTRFQTIYEKEINCNEDLSIEILDYLEPVGNIEYAYVPVISGAESNYIINSVNSSFESYFIAEKDVSYPVRLNVALNETVNYNAASVKPIGRKYPITIVNGNTGYKSGQVTATFMDIGCDNKTRTPSREYREKINEMLINYKPKIFKGYDGELYLVNIEGNIEDGKREAVFWNGKPFNLVDTKFSWVECGDAYNAKDLYYNDLIDVRQL